MDNKYRKNREVKGHLSAIISTAVSAVWQFVNGHLHLFRLNESTV